MDVTFYQERMMKKMLGFAGFDTTKVSGPFMEVAKEVQYREVTVRVCSSPSWWLLLMVFG